jgi:hypothetical protein
MRLQDSIMSIPDPVRVALPGRDVFTLPGGGDLAPDVVACPVRYVLDDAVAATTARAAFVDSAQIAKCIDLLRMPAPRFWIEWSEHGRRKVMQELGLAESVEMARLAGRAGLLVKSNAAGRAGEIQVAWDGEAGQPDLSPFIMEFDLDNPCFASMRSDDHLIRGLKVNGCEALSALLCHVRFRLRPEWRAYYEAACSTQYEFDRALQQNLAIVAADFPYLAGFCLLLAARNAVADVPVDMTRLNLSRSKRGKPPLLSHIEVKARLALPPRSRRMDRLQIRLAARMHFVTGHLVRRGANVFWRRAHIRGNSLRGVVSSRTIIMQGPVAMH